MRYALVFMLTFGQFTVIPFLAMVSANTIRHQEQQELRVSFTQQASNVTTIYKTEM